MQYMMLIYSDETRMPAPPPDAATQMSPAYVAYSEAMRKAGVVVGGDRLRPTDSATTVRISDGRTQVLNGPYAETREQLGGYYIIDVADLDEAIAWAARCPTASMGTIELRPVWPM